MSKSISRPPEPQLFVRCDALHPATNIAARHRLVDQFNKLVEAFAGRRCSAMLSIQSMQLILSLGSHYRP